MNYIPIAIALVGGALSSCWLGVLLTYGYMTRKRRMRQDAVLLFYQYTREHNTECVAPMCDMQVCLACLEWARSQHGSFWPLSQDDVLDELRKTYVQQADMYAALLRARRA